MKLSTANDSTIDFLHHHFRLLSASCTALWVLWVFCLVNAQACTVPLWSATSCDSYGPMDHYGELPSLFSWCKVCWCSFLVNWPMTYPATFLFATNSVISLLLLLTTTDPLNFTSTTWQHHFPFLTTLLINLQTTCPTGHLPFGHYLDM
jgi:hypothetical protein